MPTIEIGTEYQVPCAFIRSTFTGYTEDGPFTVLSWRPGVEYDAIDPYGEVSVVTAHGSGFVSYRVVNIHKLPTPYQARVFYVREWIDPDGRQFGNRKLRVTTVSALSRRIRDGNLRGIPAIIQDLSDAEKKKLLGEAA